MTRCPFIDPHGCRCLLRDRHGGIHDPSLTVFNSGGQLWSCGELLVDRIRQRLENEKRGEA